MELDTDLEDLMCKISTGEMELALASVAAPAPQTIPVDLPNNNERKQNTENQHPLENKENLDNDKQEITSKRFKKMTETDINELDKHQQSESTKRNTRWGVNMFEAWCIESGRPVVDLKTVEPEYLAGLLREFYASAAPKQTEKRKQSLPEKQAQEYHRNSLKSIRAALNRRLKDLDRNIDISRDTVFHKANGTLNGKLKYMVKTGASRPTQHKKIIQKNDLEKISAYLLGINDPQVLMYKVWFSLAIHFVSRGLEFHHQLTLDSFEFKSDETGRRYITITHETQQKNIQGGISDPEGVSDKRMYATDREGCPVQALEHFILHCDPEAERLFCRPKTTPIGKIWYSCKPISQRMFTDFMSKICTNCCCSMQYTSHSLRATAIQILSDAGVELRHIMLMSGHRNEASIRSYSRDCSTYQKRNISDTLSMSSVPMLQPSSELVSENSSLSAENTSHNGHQNIALSQSLSKSISSSSISASHGFLNNAAFNNCQFSFTFDTSNSASNL